MTVETSRRPSPGEGTPDNTAPFPPNSLVEVVGLYEDEPSIQARAIIAMRERFAKIMRWKGARDPDEYDQPEHKTVTAAVTNVHGRARTSLRLTELTMGGQHPEYCMSLEMLGSDTQLRREADAALSERELGREDAVVYDMTRFVTELDPAELGEQVNPRQISLDFLSLIGKAVDVTDKEALEAQTAYWVFSVEDTIKGVLTKSGITYEVLAEGKNSDGDHVSFCIVNPATSFDTLREKAKTSELASIAATRIALGKKGLLAAEETY